ncbi:calcineurin-binding protein [Infundibulicybe gibba]|nr:calcineurin-binding protein [Infundibulicybe gibba]
MPHSISRPSSSASSTSSLSSLSSPSLPPKTNTVAVTSVPKTFFQPLVLDTLRSHLASYGEINQWVPLPGFGRILVVYEEDDQAELAKRYCDPIVLDGSETRSQITLRVFRADPNPLVPRGEVASVPENNYLRPPALEKNFLISPPGSPPVGWEPIKEDPPNSSPLADDLMEALRRLKTQEHNPGVETLLEPHEGSGVGVYVEDCGITLEPMDDEWVYGETAPARTKWKPVATALPPMRAVVV